VPDHGGQKLLIINLPIPILIRIPNNILNEPATDLLNASIPQNIPKLDLGDLAAFILIQLIKNILNILLIMSNTAL
jgi:hypothetical protein